MKRAALVLFAFLVLSCAQAQDMYLGVRVDVLGKLSPLIVVVPFVGVHFGAPVLDNVELRASLATVLFASALQADILHTYPLSEALRGYGGVGGDIVEYPSLCGCDPQNFGVHATAGVESQLGSGIGLFGEVQPLFFLTDVEGTGFESFILKLNTGINFHF